MKSMIHGGLAELSSGMRKHSPVARSVHAMLGKVDSRRFRRPNVSIAKTLVVSEGKTEPSLRGNGEGKVESTEPE
jgi:hypothetical protein